MGKWGIPSQFKPTFHGDNYGQKHSVEAQNAHLRDEIIYESKPWSDGVGYWSVDDHLDFVEIASRVRKNACTNP